jgi:FHA domain
MTFTSSDSSTYYSSGIAFAPESGQPEADLDGKVASESVGFDTVTTSLNSDEGDSDESLQGRVLELIDPTIGGRLSDPVEAREIPQTPSYYIQAAQHNHRAFLTTNLSSIDAAQVTALSSTWLIGRSRNCAIVVHDRSVSRCHAVVGYDVQQGFYLMDVGSSNGSYLNQKRLTVLKRYSLVDGDVVMLCNLQFEFFIAS